MTPNFCEARYNTLYITFVVRSIVIVILPVPENEKIDPTSSPKNHTTDLT